MPSGVNATLDTRSWRPVSGWPRGWPVCASHSRALLSELPETMRYPSGLNAMVSMGDVVSAILIVVIFFISALSSGRLLLHGLRLQDVERQTARRLASPGLARVAEPGDDAAVAPTAALPARLDKSAGALDFFFGDVVRRQRRRGPRAAAACAARSSPV